MTLPINVTLLLGRSREIRQVLSDSRHIVEDLEFEWQREDCFFALVKALGLWTVEKALNLNDQQPELKGRKGRVKTASASLHEIKLGEEIDPWAVDLRPLPENWQWLSLPQQTGEGFLFTFGS